MKSQTAIAMCAVICATYATTAAQRADTPAALSDADTSGAAAPGTADLSPARDPHVRIEDARMRTVVSGAMDASPTLHALLERLEHSDVVAYVRCDMAMMSSTFGNLSFVGSGGGLRYVLIRVRHVGQKAAQAALIGHELRHAVEVADAARVIDVRSFDAEYARIGFVSMQKSEHTLRSYETMNAIQAGDQIRHELLHQNTE